MPSIKYKYTSYYLQTKLLTLYIIERIVWKKITYCYVKNLSGITNGLSEGQTLTALRANMKTHANNF